VNARALAIALLAAACSKSAAPPASAAASKTAAHAGAPELPNVLEVSRGACLVSRTGEAHLRVSAQRAIDGDSATRWLTPPGDPQQTAVYALGARARIQRVGLVTSALESAAARDIRFEFSDDGEHFVRPMTIHAQAKNGDQLANVAPIDARYLRVSVLNGGTYVQINDVKLLGTLLDEPRAPSIDGCWLLNGQPSTFAANHNDVAGYVAGEDKTSLAGGSDGHFYRFAWTRGPEYGLAAISITPDGKHLGAFVWHEEAVQADQFYENDWIGERATCTAAERREPVLETYLRRFGYFPLFGLRFGSDGTLDAAESAPLLDRLAHLMALNAALRVRFVAHELTLPTVAANRAASEKKIATLRSALASRSVDLQRVEFVAAGQEHPHREVASDITRAMYSSVDLEIRR
jgi:hypothetical protein